MNWRRKDVGTRSDKTKRSTRAKRASGDTTCFFCLDFIGGLKKMLRYEENKIYTAECNNCGCLFTIKKDSQTEMELFLKKSGWEVWKSKNAHQPNCLCPNCRQIEEMEE